MSNSHASLLAVDQLNTRAEQVMPSSLQKALGLVEEAVNLAKEIKYLEGEAKALYLEGVIYFQLGDLKVARAKLKKALPRFEKVRFRDLEMNCHLQLTNVNEALGDTVQLRHHFQKYHGLKQVQQAYTNVNLLGEIGKTIVNSRSVEEIVVSVYDSINKIMDAFSLAIGLYDVESYTLNFPLSMENGQKLEGAVISLSEHKYASLCLLDQTIIFVNDQDAEYHFYLSEYLPPFKGQDTQSLIYVPITMGEKRIGVLTVQSDKKGAYTDYHLNILQNIAVYVSIAIAHNNVFDNLEAEVENRTEEVVQQREALQKTYENLRELSDIGREITSCLNIESISQSVYKKVNKIMDATGFGIGIFNPTNETIAFPGYIEKEKVLKGSLYHIKDLDRMPCVCFTRDIEILINDFEKEHGKFIKFNKAPVVGEHVQSLIYIPVKSKNKKVGLITVQSFKKNAYSAVDVTFLRSLSVYVAIALENLNAIEEIKLQNEAYRELEKKEAEIATVINRLNVINNIVTSILQSESPDELLFNSMKALISTMSLDRVSIVLFDLDNYTYTSYSLAGTGKMRISEAYPLKDYGNIQIMLKQEYKYVRNLKAQYNRSASDNRLLQEGIISYVLHPLIVRGQVIGSLNISSKVEIKFEKHELLEIIKEASGAIATALYQGQLQKQVEESMILLQEQNESIRENMIYAQQIQKAVLPDRSYIDSLLNNFIFYQPKDVVSGDFYWAGESPSGKRIWAVGDCTGHGVPGAFMSLIGNNFMNDIVINNQIEDPGAILGHMRNAIKTALNQNAHKEKFMDGINMSICVLDTATGVLKFAGGLQDALHVRKNTLTELEGDRQPVGFINFENLPFTTKEIKVQVGDMIYLYSDGYGDQFGGPNKRKFMSSKFISVLSAISSLELKEQYLNLKTIFEDWKGELPQIDDICVFGVRV